VALVATAVAFILTVTLFFVFDACEEETLFVQPLSCRVVAKSSYIQTVAVFSLSASCRCPRAYRWSSRILARRLGVRSVRSSTPVWTRLSANRFAHGYTDFHCYQQPQLLAAGWWWWWWWWWWLTLSAGLVRFRNHLLSAGHNYTWQWSGRCFVQGLLKSPPSTKPTRPVAVAFNGNVIFLLPYR